MRQDILVNKDRDLSFHKGDFDLGRSDGQHIEHLVEAQKGEYKEFLFIGFGIVNYLKKTNKIKSDFKRDLKIQLEYDGYSTPNIDLSDGFENLKIQV